MNYYTYWQEIETLMDEVLDLQEELRLPHIKKKCRHNRTLLEEAIDYYKFIKKAADTSFLDNEFVASSDLLGDPELASQDKDITEEFIGSTIGPYQICKLLGEGGMGSVFLAERVDGEFKQKVAIKFLRGGFYSSYMRKRFNNEKKILSRLNHPNIASIIDGGITGDGTPYLTMEYIDGIPVDEFCIKHSLDVEDRLKLFLQITKAVQYAHSKLIIHRDLKPENIFVTETGDIKVMDFGIAKFLNPGEDDELQPQTREGQFVASFNFAAPEHFRSDEYTIKTDVYGLGALLYLLVTGEYPHKFDDYSISEIEKAIKHKEPKKPSEISGSEFGVISSDLEAIILNALRKEPDQRYGSVEMLAEDINRYLNGLPVTVKTATFGYQTAKFFRRNRKTVVTSVIILAGILSLLFYHNNQLAKERDIAQQEAQKAEQISSFLVNMFEMADPEINQGESLTAEEILDQGISRVDRLSDQPELQVEILKLAGNIYQSFGELENSKETLESALNLAQITYGQENGNVADILNSLGTLYRSRHEYDKAREMFLGALNIHRNPNLTYGNTDIACTLHNLGIVERWESNFDLSENYYQEVIDHQDLLINQNSSCIAKALNGYGTLNRRQGKFDEAVSYHEQSLKLIRSGDSSTLKIEEAQILNSYGITLMHKNNYDRSIDIYNKAKSINKTLLGKDHPSVATNLNNIANVYIMNENFENAAIHYRKALEIRKKRVGENHRDVAKVYMNLGLVHLHNQDLQEARIALKYAVDIYYNIHGTNHLSYSQALTNYSAFYQVNAEYEKAKELLEEALEIIENLLPEGHWMVALVKGRLGNSLSALGEDADAEYYLTRSYEIMKEERGPNDSYTVEVRDWLEELRNN